MRRSCVFLEQQAFDVLDVRRSGLVGSTDLAILRQVGVEQRTVVTHDRDFGRLAIAAAEPFFGILYLRPGHLDPAFTVATLRSVLGADLTPEPPFILVAERQQEREDPPPPPRLRPLRTARQAAQSPTPHAAESGWVGEPPLGRPCIGSTDHTISGAMTACPALRGAPRRR